MTILSPQTLLNVLDLIADGATVVETTTAIGGAPKSKIIFVWLADSEAAGEFDPPPNVDSPWCLEWRGALEWFHIAYRIAAADGKEVRRARKSPLRAELEQRLAEKQAQRADAAKLHDVPRAAHPPRVVQEPIPVTRPAPPPRPAYAYRAPPLDIVNATPPSEGRFSVSRHVVSRAERQAGKPEVTDQGIIWH